MGQTEVSGRRTIVFAAAFWLMAYSSVSSALKGDSDQPIYIDSNSATYDDAKGVSIYIGNVVTTQGSMKMYSDELIIYIKNGDVTKMVATGNPVRFKQTPEVGKEDITGHSLRAEYYPDKTLLVLKEDAVVKQGENAYASDLIEYDSKNSIVKAGEKTSDTKRVHVIIKPKEKKSE
ncbi:MAG: lipopolysaccharide transport periplasmic protein LptA [Gammaproteobacteria bacterium]